MSMKLRHAAALALVGWTMLIYEPKYCPRENVNCANFADQLTHIKLGFPTKDSCQKAVNQWWFNFEKMLEDTNKVVVTTVEPSECLPADEVR